MDTYIYPFLQLASLSESKGLPNKKSAKHLKNKPQLKILSGIIREIEGEILDYPETLLSTTYDGKTSLRLINSFRCQVRETYIKILDMLSCSNTLTVDIRLRVSVC
jgi:hypothetical protein